LLLRDIIKPERISTVLKLLRHEKIMARRKASLSVTDRQIDICRERAEFIQSYIEKVESQQKVYEL
jgi:hypothetical protein